MLINETSGTNSGCSIVTVPFNITESAIPLSLSTSIDQNANCNTDSGIISAIAQNGTPPYLYQVTTTATPPITTDPSWATASTFNLNAGNYYVHVIDAYNCIVSSPVILLPLDASPVISASVNNECSVNEGAYEIDVAITSIGIPPYSFSIDGGAFQNLTAPFTISNLFSGTHTVEIADTNGCGNLVSIDIAPPLNSTPNITSLPSCNNDDGEITITSTGGTGSYSYSISPNPASISLVGNVFSGVPSGLYTVTIVDTTTSCSEDVIISVPSATPLTFSTNPSSVACFGDNSGTIEMTINGYSGPYNYEVFDSLGTSVTGIVGVNTSTNPIIISG